MSPKKVHSPRIMPNDRTRFRYVVDVPRNWRTRELLKVLRENVLNDTLYQVPLYTDRRRLLAEQKWATFCTDLVNHTINRRGVEVVLEKWGIRLNVREPGFPYRLGSY